MSHSPRRSCCGVKQQRERGLTRSERCYGGSSDDDGDSDSDSDEEEEEGEKVPPGMKKYRDGVKNGLGVTMKIKWGDSMMYFPGFTASDSNVVPLKVSTFSEISKDFKPHILKEDIPKLLKKYGILFSITNYYLLLFY